MIAILNISEKIPFLMVGKIKIRHFDGPTACTYIHMQYLGNFTSLKYKNKYY